MTPARTSQTNSNSFDKVQQSSKVMIGLRFSKDELMLIFGSPDYDLRIGM